MGRGPRAFRLVQLLQSLLSSQGPVALFSKYTKTMTLESFCQAAAAAFLARRARRLRAARASASATGLSFFRPRSSASPSSAWILTTRAFGMAPWPRGATPPLAKILKSTLHGDF